MRNIKRYPAILLAIAGCMTLFGCVGQSSYDRPDLTEKMEKTENHFSFSTDGGEDVYLGEQEAQRVCDAITEITLEFPYEELYETDKAMERLGFDASVEEHSRCAADDRGELSSARLCETVLENNVEYLSDSPFGYSSVEDDYALDICELIVETVGYVLEKYPEVDRERVYCNLAHLKILYKTGMLDFASVNEDMVMSVSNNSANIAEVNKGKGAYRNVMIHETMHLIQIGCPCEDLGDHATRRCGICVFWSDWDMNSADWGWIFEGGAERLTSVYTESPPLTYAYKVDYLCTFDTALLLREENSCDRMETLCLYDDPFLLFEAFGAESDEDRREIVNAMICINILQMTPEAFYTKYEKAYGTRPDADDDSFDRFSYSLKPVPLLFASKCFYKNLTDLLSEKRIGANDLCFIINSFESSLNMHLNFQNSDMAEINKPFTEGYGAIREAFFLAVKDSSGIDIERLYSEYEICKKGESTLCASLEFLPEEKREFFRGRAQRQWELNKLGIKFGVAYDKQP